MGAAAPSSLVAASASTSTSLAAEAETGKVAAAAAATAAIPFSDRRGDEYPPQDR